MVVARRKSGSKSAKRMDPTKYFVISKQQSKQCYHAYSATKLDQFQARKRKASLGQDSLGQKAKDGPVVMTVGLLKRAHTDFNILTDQEKAPPSPFAPGPFIFYQGQCFYIRGKKGMA